MPKASPGLTRFNAGEWSPQTRGRIDLDGYAGSLRTMRNFTPTIQGAAIKRSGTKFVAPLSEQSRTYSAQGFVNITTGAPASEVTVSLGFDPTVIFLWLTGETGTPDSTENDAVCRGSFGFATSDGSQFGTGWRHRSGGVSPSETYHFRSTTDCLYLPNSSSDSLDGSASVTDFSSGFTLTINNAFNGNYFVRYWAMNIPGAEIQAYTSPTSTGSDAIGPFGFNPDSAFFIRDIGASGSVDVDFTLGICAGTGYDQYCMALSDEDAVTPISSKVYSQNGEAIVNLPIGTNPDERASVTSMSGGYINVNFAEVNGAGLDYYVLAMNTNGALEAFDFSTTTGTGDITVSGLSGKPVGAMFFSTCLPESTSDTADGVGQVCIMSGVDSSNQGGFTMAPLLTGLAIEASSIDHIYTRVSSGPITAGTVAISSVEDDGFVLNQDEADADTSLVFGWALTSTISSALNARLIPFKFNSTDAHILEFGSFYMRVYTDGGVQLSGFVSITAATQADPVEITSAAHGLANGQGVYISGVLGMTELNGRFFEVSNVSTNTFELSGVDGSGYTAYTSGGTAEIVYEIATPYPSFEVSKLQWEQSADVLYITHPDYPPQKLSRLANDSWTLEELSLDWPPFRAENLDDTDYITASAATGSITLTSTGGHFDSDQIGGYIRFAERKEANQAEWVGATAAAQFSVSVGEYCWYANNVYELISLNGHTNYDGTSPPVHETGTRTDGHWSWLWKSDGAGYAQIDSITSAYRATATVIREIPFACVDDDFTISTISNATPPVVTVSATHDYETGDIVWIQGVSGSASVFNNAYYTITDTGAATFSLDDQSASGTGTGGQSVRVATGDSNNHFASSTPNGWKDHDLWSFGAFSEKYGYPKAVVIHEDRLVFAGTASDPAGIWMSRTSQYDDFERRSDDDGGLFVVLSTGDPIEWLQSQNAIVAGTAGSEHASPRDIAPLASSSVHQIRKKSTYGSREFVSPVQLENILLFTPRSGRELRELIYDIDAGDFQASNLALLSEHLTTGIIQRLAFQARPRRIVWVLMEDGTLRGMTYERSEKVIGWHRMTPGGTDVRVLDIAVIPDSSDTSRDQLWMLVQRTINSDTYRSIEYLNADWVDTNSIEDAFFVDIGSTYDGAAVTNVTNLYYLEGESVAVLADGVEITGRTISNGTLDTALSTAASVIHVGLAYNADLETQTFEAGSANGVAQGKIQRINRAVLRLYQTGSGLQYGPDYDNLRETYHVTPGTLYDGDTELLAWPAGHERGSRIALRHSTPLPCEIAAIFPLLVTND